MSISMWLRTSRIRRGLAASAIVLAAGGLVLFRAPTGGGFPTISPAIASPNSINSVSFAGPGVHGTIALSNGKVLAGRSQLFAEVHLVADKAEQAPRHAPLALVVVLDTSGSMSGEKMDQAKDSCVKLIRDMDANDEIAFIRYSDDAEVIQSLARVGTVRESLMARVRGLSAGGGTAIPRGLSQGLSALASTHGERIRRVVLVSDGLDSTRAEAERLASAPDTATSAS
jgi:Ca-activated chloride channel family protein